MRYRDTDTRYGAVSIMLHWGAALVVIAMLGIGNVVAAGGRNADVFLSIHTTIAVLAYPFLTVRVFWRFKSGHPDALPRQSSTFVNIAKVVHYVMIGLIILMLLSGPLTAWAGGLPVRVFGWEIPSPTSHNNSIFSIGRTLHAFGAGSLLALIVLHIGAALFHIVFKKDETLDKILIAPKDA